MCPNTELFLVRIFPHSDCIRRDTKYLSVFSPNTGKYGPEITPDLDTFHVVNLHGRAGFSSFLLVCCHCLILFSPFLGSYYFYIKMKPFIG